MVRPGAASASRLPEPDWSHILQGCDPTTGIVSVDADTAGRATVWRRVGSQIEVTDHRFPNWLLTTNLDLLAHLPMQHLDASALRAAHGNLGALSPGDDRLIVVDLDSAHLADEDEAYRYLVLTTDLEEISTTLVEMSSKSEGGDVQSLDDLRGLVYFWPPIEQFLALSGLTYFKGLAYRDLRRMQFDLETTGLDEDRDRIFMISMRDSDGWHECLDTGSWSEAALIERFVDAVRARDPDVLENHNLFAFDLPFLVKRAARLGVSLGLGRDGSEPIFETDVFDAGDRAEPFVRCRIRGREVADTQQAVRRFGLKAPDMRRRGLKDAARYFGLARAEREYVAGVDVWPTYQRDPERIRRYAQDDVDEVDGLSRRLFPEPFGLASMLSRSYERIAGDCSARSLWEPLLVRAYLHEGRAIAAPMPREHVPGGPPPADLFRTGVIGRSARAVLERLVPSLIAAHAVSAAKDDLRVLPQLVRRLLERPMDSSAEALASSALTYLWGDGLLSDSDAAERVRRLARDHVEHVMDDLQARGCVVVEVDGEQLTFAMPATWNRSMERELAAGVAAYVPPGVQLRYTNEYAGMYLRAPRSSIVLDARGGVTLIGSSFRPGRIERFGEAFIHRAAPFVVSGDAVAVRQVFLETVHWLRTAQFELDDVCVQVVLHKSQAQYRRALSREEPYEVLLAGGVRSWRVGQRMRYFRARGGEARLHVEGDGQTAVDADADYYVQRLYAVYCQQFSHAFRREDFGRIFRIPAGPGPYSEDAAADLRAIRSVSEPVGCA